jgi:hypothetical protein
VSVYEAPPSIDPDGSRDVAGELTDWLNSLPDGTPETWTMARLQPAARYRIDSSFLIEKKSYLSLDGYGASLDARKTADGQARHVWAKQSHHLKLANLRVRGANPKAGARAEAFVQSMQWQHPFGFWGCSNVTLQRLQAYDVYGDFVSIDPMLVDGKPVSCENYVIRYCHFERNGRMGIGITGGSNFLIEHNYIGQVRHALLDMEPEWATLPMSNVTFRRNVTGETWLPWVACGGLCNTDVSNIRITENVMQSGTTAGVPLVHIAAPSGCAKRGPIYIERNTLFCRSSPRAAVEFQGVRRAYVRDNRLVFGADARGRVFTNVLNSETIRVERNSIDHQLGQIVTVLQTDASSVDCIEVGNAVRQVI